MAGIDESLPFKPVRIAVMTVSDTRTIKDDKSGSLLAGMLTEAGHELADHVVVKDDISANPGPGVALDRRSHGGRGDHHGRHRASPDAT